MTFLKRVFDRRKAPVAEPLHGMAVPQTQAQQTAARERMESGLRANGGHQGATDARAGTEPPARVPPDKDAADDS